MLKEAVALAGLLTMSSPSLAVVNSLGVKLVKGANQDFDPLGKKTKLDTTDVVTDLRAMTDDKGNNLNTDTYAKGKNDGIPKFISLVEWGFSMKDIATPNDYYHLYLYILNPLSSNNIDTGSRTDWSKVGQITMAFVDASKDMANTSADAYYSFPITEISRSSDNQFIKYRIENPSDYFSFVKGKEKRRYLLGRIDLTDSKTGKKKAYPLGKDIVFGGEPKNPNAGLNQSTLNGKVGDVDSIYLSQDQIYSYASTITSLTTSDFVGAGYFSNPKPATTKFQAFNVDFALPQKFDKYGTLVKVHYDYYKYRTNWMYITEQQDDYNQLMTLVDQDSLVFNKDVKHHFNDKDYYIHTYNYKRNIGNVAWFAPVYFDQDDRPDIPAGFKIDEGTSTKAGFVRYFNNHADAGHTEFRMDNPKWVFYTGGKSIGDYTLQSESILDYYSTFRKTIDPDGTDDLPRLNGTVSNKLFYVPSYSNDSGIIGSKYGYVNRSISNEDLSSENLSKLLSDRLNDVKFSSLSYLGYWGSLILGPVFVPKLLETYAKLKLGSYEIDPNKNLGENYLEAIKKNNALDYAKFFSNGVRLLSDKLEHPYDDVFYAYPYSNEIAQEGLNNLEKNNPNSSFYRLTYDFGLANAYRTTNGNGDFADGTFIDSNGSLAKSDVVLDFRFIDFKFKDSNNVSYTLPLANDPFDQALEPTVPKIPSDDKTPWWVYVLITLAVLAVAGIVLMVVFPVLKPIFKAVFKGIGKTLKYVFEIAFTAVYFVGIWWWLALIQKITGRSVSKLWLF